MSRHSSLWIAAALLGLAGCEERHEARGEPPELHSAPAHVVLPAAPPVSEASLYDLSLDLSDQDGRKIGLDVFRGQPVVISMFYAGCAYACPTLIADIQRFERALDESARRDVRVLLVTFDTVHDTTERLKALARERKIDETRWKLARAPEDQVRELAAALGIKYRSLENGGFNHSSAITLLRSDGVVAERSEGLGQPVDALASRARQLLKNTPGEILNGHTKNGR